MSGQKYYIYSSDAGQSTGPDKLILKEGLPIDSFVSLLKNKVIILKDTPEAEKPTPCDASDEWAKWLGNFGEKAEISVMLDPDDDDPDDALQSFRFNIEGPAKTALIFDSSSEILESSFGVNAAGSIDPPGALTTSAVLLYNGLVAPSSDLTVKVEDIFIYVGLDDLLENLPSSLAPLTATISSSSYEGRRNALWFNPKLDMQTIVRLDYQVDAKAAFEGLLQNQVPNLEFVELSVICRKVLTQGLTSDDELIGVDKGDVSFQATCAISNTTRAENLEMIMGINFSESGMSFTMKPNQESESNLNDVLQWLGQVVDINLLPVLDFFGSGAFERLHLQQVVLTFSTTVDREKPSLIAFRVDIEVAGNFGEVDNKRPVFLMTYSWTSARGGLGRIRGQLWDYYDMSAERTLQPYYEVWTDLRPITTNPGTAINLKTLVPGQTIDIPENIPSQISNAFIELSQDSIAIGGLVNTKEPEEDEDDSQVPQPYLQQLQLDLSYEWGNSSAFKFDFRVLAGIPPPQGTAYDQDTTISGELRYLQGGERYEDPGLS